MADHTNEVDSPNNADSSNSNDDIDHSKCTGLEHVCINALHRKANIWGTRGQYTRMENLARYVSGKRGECYAYGGISRVIELYEGANSDGDPELYGKWRWCRDRDLNDINTSNYYLYKKYSNILITFHLT
jgi:hypothetical protein